MCMCTGILGSSVQIANIGGALHGLMVGHLMKPSMTAKHQSVLTSAIKEQIDVLTDAAGQVAAGCDGAF